MDCRNNSIHAHKLMYVLAMYSLPHKDKLMYFLAIYQKAFLPFLLQHLTPPHHLIQMTNGMSLYQQTL